MLKSICDKLPIHDPCHAHFNEVYQYREFYHVWICAGHNRVVYKNRGMGLTTHKQIGKHINDNIKRFYIEWHII